MASKLRPYHRDLCVLLSTSNETLTCLTGSLFGARVIDKINKTAIIGQKGFEGADQLLNLVYNYLEGDDDSDEKSVRFETVLGLLEAEEMLRDVTRKIREQVTLISKVCGSRQTVLVSYLALYELEE